MTPPGHSAARAHALCCAVLCVQTTFLNVLCGKVPTGIVTGRVRINGELVQLDQLKNIMGFVPQEDVVHEDLTVK